VSRRNDPSAVVSNFVRVVRKASKGNKPLGA
jgi:hypothetical protein